MDELLAVFCLTVLKGVQLPKDGVMYRSAL
jgi:hypothetical protein